MQSAAGHECIQPGSWQRIVLGECRIPTPAVKEHDATRVVVSLHVALVVSSPACRRDRQGPSRQIALRLGVPPTIRDGPALWTRYHERNFVGPLS